MNMKMCLNWKVLVGLGVVTVGILVVDPPLAGRALPLLLVAACPLSMVLMGVMMARHNGQPAQSTALAPTSDTGEFTCQMHADVRSSWPARCPKCGMKMVSAAPRIHAPTPNDTNRVLTRDERIAWLQTKLHDMAGQQALLSRQVEQLRAAEESATPNRTLDEAERVAQAAENRSGR